MEDDKLLIACPQCVASNRVPRARLEDGPRCGKCATPLLTGTPIELDDVRFERFVQRSGLPVLVDLWAEWCGPCRQMAPQFAAAAERERGRIVFAKLDTEAAPRTAQRLAVQAIPTLVLFDGGVEVARRSGASSADQILAWVAAAGLGPR
jgi:thioredoxin 2